MSGLAAGIREPVRQAGATPEPWPSPAATASAGMGPETPGSRAVPAGPLSGVSGTVLVVAAGFAYPRQHLAANAYAYQSGRSLRRDVDWIAFYADGAIREHIARIWYCEDQILISGTEGGRAGPTGRATEALPLQTSPTTPACRQRPYRASTRPMIRRRML